MAIDATYIRKFATDAYVKPARQRGERSFAIAVKPVEADLRKRGLATGRTPLVCSALRGNKFQAENGIVLDRWEGPPSGQSPTVVYHFRFVDAPKGKVPAETSEQWAFRVTEKIRGLLKEEIASRGGAEGYLRWVRSADEDEA